MRIVPYVSVADIPFDSDEAAILSACGAPERRDVNSLGLLELIYSTETFRLSAETRRLVEVTVCHEYVEIEGCSLSNSKLGETAFVELGYSMAKLDQDSFLAHGFIVSPRFGLAFDPQYAPYLTIFARSELAAWQGYRKLP